MASQARRRRHEDFQIAVICALPLEYDAVVFACDEIWEEDREQLSNAPRDYNTYSTGRIGPHNVVLLLLPGMGKTNAASAAASLRSTYKWIKLAILTGICGGVPGIGTSNEVFLGDVVISKSIMQYDLGRQYPSRFDPKDTIEDSLGRPNKEIRSLVATLQTLHGRSSLQCRASQVLEQIRQRAVDEGHQNLYKRPTATEDHLFEPEYLHRHRDCHSCECSESKACEKALTTSCDVLQCDYSRLVVRSLPDMQTLRLQGQTDDSMVARQVRILVGRMGSGDTVMKSGLDRDRIAEEHDLIAFEMEGAGVWDEIPCIIVKAVCDYADSHKNKKWQHFAAATAASTTKALLERYSHMDSPSTSQTWFLVPYNENPDFIGRSQTLNQIKRLFGHEQQFDQSLKPRSRVALYGLGGIGKTQIALAYALWLQRDHPDVSVFWVHASNADRFRQGYIAIARECNIPGRDNSEADVLILVKTWLEKGIRGRWLMVIDNADDTQLFFPSSSPDGSTNTHSTTEKPGGLGRYIPECAHGSILITTRNKQTALKLVRSNPLLKIEGMSDNETNQLLNTMLDDEVHTDEASDLSKRLEHLPLAVAQAAAFIQENTISISQYLQLLEESDESLVNQLSEPFEAVGRDSETPHALTSTWIVSFNQIQQQEALASDVLSFASLLDRQGIPEEFIVSFCNQRDTDEQQMSTSKITKAIGVLKAFSFVSQAKDNAITMHRLVQLVTRKWLETQKRLASYAEQALDIVADLYPHGKHENRQVCQEYLPHANAVLQNKGTDSRDERLAKALLLYNIGGYFRYRGPWKQAEQSTIQSMRLYHEVFGHEHSDTLNSMTLLATVYWNQGRWKEAEELGVQVLETRRRVLGDEHPETLLSIANLATTYQDQGRWKEAEELEVQVLETRRRVLGDEHPDTLISIGNLASIYRDQGRWKEAEELDVQVLETRRRVLGDEHPDTLFSIANLASTYWNQGRWKEAEELRLQVLETEKRVLGDEHPETLRSMAWLAHIWKSQGREVDAVQLMRECHGLRQRCLGVDHPSTMDSLSDLEKWEKDLIQS